MGGEIGIYMYEAGHLSKNLLVYTYSAFVESPFYSEYYSTICAQSLFDSRGTMSYWRLLPVC